MFDVEGLEQHTLQSVGIDIGSSTSHVVISQLTLRRRGGALSTEFVVTDREIRYASQPFLTPYRTARQIDANQLGDFLRQCYRAAGVEPDEMDTGAVVVTGEALNKENAEHIAALFAQWSGKFICISAGPNHEAVLAAHGSGSVALAERTGDTVLNVDIGGGTTKVSLIIDGLIAHTEAFTVGARLVALDDRSELVRVEEPAHVLAGELGIDLRLGDVVSQRDLDRLAELMAELVIDAIIPTGRAQLRRRLLVTPKSDSPQHVRRPQHIVFSGGVSEYIRDSHQVDYGDLGPRLGTAISDRLREHGLHELITAPTQGIRATVLGASQFTVQASGQTSFVSDAATLPVWGLQVVRVRLAADSDPRAALRTALQRHDVDGYRDDLAIALSFDGPTGYRRLRSCAEALTEMARGVPNLFVVLRDDLARSLGRIMRDELSRTDSLVIVDGIDLGDLDFLDIGPPMGRTGALPVTVKSLAFPTLH